MRKLLFFLLAIIFAMQGLAQPIWDGSADASWYNASQSSFDINTPEQLAGLAQLVNSGTTFSGKTINLTADIWLNSTGQQTNQWTPIGENSNGEGGCPGGSGSDRFGGTFNGNFYSVYNMYINNTANTGQGFFGGLSSATITQLYLVNPVVITSGMSGCLASTTHYGVNNISKVMIINAQLSASCNNSAFFIGATYPGGSANFTNCGVTGSFTGTSNVGYFGGFCGNGNNTYYTNCYTALTWSCANSGVQWGSISAYNGTLTNTYSNVTSNDATNARKNANTILTDAEMQASGFPASLGAAWMEDVNNINNGFPILNPCVPPSGITTTATGPYSANLSWSGIAGITQYYVEWGPAGFTPGTGTQDGDDVVLATNISISGLTPSTAYTIAVKSDCGSSTTSSWVTYNFNTTILCDQPTGLTVSNNTTSTLDLTWTGPLNATAYNIEWGPNDNSWTPGAGDSPGYGTSSTANYQMTGLADASTYKIAVQTDCGSTNGTSQWITTIAGTVGEESFGNEIWHGYVYSQVNNAQKTFNNYMGYVEEHTQQFSRNKQNTGAAWNGDVTSWLSGSNGPADNFSVRYKMTKNFTCGDYVFTLDADDYWRLSIDGGLTWLPSYAVNDPNNKSDADQWTTGCCTPWRTSGIPLNGTYNMVIEFSEGGGGAYLEITWATQPIAVTVPAATNGPHAAEINFSAGTNWDLVVSTTPISDLDNIPGDVLLNINTSSNPYSLTGLTPVTTYYVYARPTDCGMAWGNTSFQTTILCAQPTAISASNVGTTSADISWTGSGNAESYNIEWGPAGSFTPGDGTAPNSDVASASPYQITTGLQAATQYTVAIQSDCGSTDGQSTWTAYNFTTENCNPSEQCIYTLRMFNGPYGYASDWGSTQIIIKQNGIQAFISPVVSGGGGAMTPVTHNVTLCKSLLTEIEVINAGGYYNSSDYCQWELKDISGTVVAYKASGPTINGVSSFSIGPDCYPCFAPTITSSAITETSFNLGFSLGASWNIKVSTVPLASPATDFADIDEITETTDNPYSVSGLTAATLYYIYVQNACGSNWASATVTTLATCFEATGLAVSAITTNSAHLEWNAPTDGADAYIIEYGPAATFTPGAGNYENTFTTTNTYYDLSSLLSATAYKFAVRSDCGSGSISIWQTINFGTTAVETFGDGIWHGYVYQSPQPDVWQDRFQTYLGYIEEEAEFTKANTSAAWTGGNSNTVWAVGTSGPLENFAVRYKMTYDFPCGNYTLKVPGVDDAARLSIDGGATWLSNLCLGSNCGSTGNWEINGGYHNGTYEAENIFLSGVTDLVLEFYEAGGGAGVGFDMDIQPIVITASELTSNSVDLAFSIGTEWNIKVFTAQPTDPATDPADFTIPNVTENPYSLTGLTPETTYYIYVQLACGGTWNNTSITTVSSCPEPLGLTALASGTSADLSWLALGMTGWNLKVSATTLTDPDNQTGTIFDNWVDNNNYQVTGLTTNNTYYWYVQSDCGSPWASGQFTVKTSGTDCNSAIVVNQSDIPYTHLNGTTALGNDINNDCFSSGYYDNGDDAIYKINLTQPMTLNFVMTTGSYYTSMGLFSGCPTSSNRIAESIGSSGSKSLNNVSLQPGTYYLMLDSWPSPQNYTYNLTIGCGTPSLTVTGITTTDANLNITSYASDLYLKVSTIPINPATTDGDIIANDLVPTGSPYPLTGLSSSTDYYVYISTGCSPWVSATFTTTITCAFPTALSVANTNHNSTEFTFTGTATALQYDVEWGPQGFIPGTGTEENSATIVDPLTELPLLITGLSEITDYTVAVRSDCGSGDVSGWKTLTFRTLPDETYGNGIWHGYVYNAPSSKVFGDYLGYVEEQAQFSRNYTTQGAAWSGENEVWLVPAPADNISARYRMTYNFTGNNYKFTINADDYFRLSVDGGATWLPFTTDDINWTTAANNFWSTSCCNAMHSASVAVNGYTDLVLEFNEGGGGAYLIFSFENLDCPAPTGITAGSITANSAEISWTGNVGATDYTMEVCAPGVTQGNGDVYPNVTSPAPITGLTGNTLYTVYIKSNCGSSESSYASFTFTSACDAVPNSLIGFTEEAGWTGTSIPPTAAAGTFNGFKGTNDCNGSAPTCWDVSGNCLYGTSGNNYPRAELGNNTRYMIMPPLASDVTMTNLKMKIWIRSDNASQGLNIFVTNGNNLTGIELLTTIEGGQSSTFSSGEPHVVREVDLGAFYGTVGATGTRIGFAPSANHRVDIYKVVIWQELPPACVAPSAITVTGVTDNEATVSWTAGDTETEWAVQYRQQGVSSWTAVAPNPTTTSCNISGLSAQTTYEVQVKAICSATSESAWTPSVNFTTSCAPFAVPFTESFPTNPPAFPACWSAYRDNVFSTNGVATDIFMANSSSGCTGRSLRLYANYTNGILISPPLNVDANLLEITYCSRRENNASPVGTVSVGYLADLNDPTSFVAIETYSTNTDYPEHYTGYNFTVDLSSVPAGITHVAFKHATNGTTGTAGWIWLDEITFDYLPAPCDSPTDVTVSAITQTTATVSWTASATALSYDVEYKPTSSSTWSAPISVTAPNVSTGLTGLTANTQYDVRVKGVCASNESSYATATPFTTLAVPCYVPTALADNSVTQTAATITWTVGGTETEWQLAWKETSESTWNYEGVTTNATHDLSGLTAATAYDVKVRAICAVNDSSSWTAIHNFTTANFCNAPTALAANSITQTAANITWTAGGTETEWLLEYGIGSNYGTPISVSTQPHPLSGLEANTTYNVRMRAVCSSAVGDTSIYSNVATFTTLPYPCDDPSGLTITNLAQTTATVSWIASATALSYKVEYKLHSSSTWSTPIIVTAPAVSTGLTGLTVNTEYDVRVKSVCNGNESNYITTTFTTLSPACAAPTGVMITNIASTTATVSWIASVTAVSYVVEYKLASSPTWDNTPITLAAPATSTGLTGLTAETQYNVRVKSICSSNESGYAMSVPFSTLPVPCDDPTGVTVSAITQTGATVSWTASATAVSYTVEYKLTSSPTWSNTPITVLAPATSTGLTGLTAATQYNVRVKGICASNESNYATASPFTTLAIPCEDPTGVTHSNVTHNSATITWTAGGTETNWKVEWQLESTTTWYSATTTEAMYALINLIANSCYNVRVKAVCNPGDESDWSAVDNFCTPQIPCDAPTNVVTTNITDHTITVAWTPNGTEDSWKIFYRVAGENAAQIGPITAPTYTLTDLTDSTEYEICVLSVCQSVQSDSTCILATTLDAVGISTITMANNLQLYPNPTTGELRIKNYELREGDKIEIYNMLGQKQQLSTNNYPLNTIDVSHLSAGMYTLKIGGYVGKFVKKY